MKHGVYTHLKGLINPDQLQPQFWILFVLMTVSSTDSKLNIVKQSIFDNFPTHNFFYKPDKQKTHTDRGRTQKLHKERPNLGPSC